MMNTLNAHSTHTPFARICGNSAAQWLQRMGIAVAASALLASAGCQNNKTTTEDFFVGESAIHSVDRFAAAQAAAGAHEDAMLQPQHFDGGELNSLGRSKLHLMTIHKPAAEPLTIYLDVPSDAQQGHRQAVSRYIEQQAILPASDVRIEMGPNPNLAHPAQAQLQRLSKTENVPGEYNGDTGAATFAPTPTDTRGSGNADR